MRKFNSHQIIRLFYQTLTSFGVDFRKMFQFLRGIPAYIRDYIVFIQQSRSSSVHFKIGAPLPCLTDRFAQSGIICGHYFYQDLHVARRIHENKPKLHVDVGSRIDGFVAHVASFRPIEVIDIRPLKLNIQNIQFIQADLMKVGDGSLVNYCDSLSCLHALEHFGLGRYGDTVAYNGHLAGLRNLSLMLKPGGKFYLSVPIGPQRVEFNAHRIFSVEYILALIEGQFKLDSFSFVDDEGVFHNDVAIGEVDSKASFGCIYGCGIFELTKS